MVIKIHADRIHVTTKVTVWSIKKESTKSMKSMIQNLASTAAVANMGTPEPLALWPQVSLSNNSLIYFIELNARNEVPSGHAQGTLLSNLTCVICTVANALYVIWKLVYQRILLQKIHARGNLAKTTEYVWLNKSPYEDTSANVRRVLSDNAVRKVCIKTFTSI